MTIPSRWSRSPFSVASSVRTSVMGGVLLSGGLDYGRFVIDLDDRVVLDGPDHLIRTRDDLVSLGEAGENLDVGRPADARLHFAERSFERIRPFADHEDAGDFFLIGFHGRGIGIQGLVLAGVEIAFGAN